jgi:hypothetical protein
VIPVICNECYMLPFCFVRIAVDCDFAKELANNGVLNKEGLGEKNN